MLKISDFGLSKVRPDPNKKETDRFTMTGETGSYRFMGGCLFLLVLQVCAMAISCSADSLCDQFTQRRKYFYTKTTMKPSTFIRTQ